jgi:ATP-dependent Lhr-like helicase
VRELTTALTIDEGEVQRGLGELVAAGLVTSDGYGGLRSMLVRAPARVSRPGRARSRAAIVSAGAAGGRWSLWRAAGEPGVTREVAIELHARTLLKRYGIVFRRLLARETPGVSWRELVAVFRRLEARGEIRGGRFVLGMSGEQFALPEAVAQAREVRRTPPSSALTVICGADPLNLVGIVTSGDRVAAIAGTRVAFRDGVPLAVMEGDYVRQLHEYEPEAAGAVSSALAGRAVRAITSGFVGRIEAMR